MGWRANLLSYAGKVTLLKYVILVLPTHLLAGCKVPKAVLDRLEKLIGSFLWNNFEDKKGYHLISWSKVSKAKGEDGLGLYYFKEVSKALMGKILFNFIRRKEEKWIKWIYSKYKFKKKI